MSLFATTQEHNTNRPLIAFAFLAQTSYKDGDLVSGLTPIFKPLVKAREGKQFDPVEFSDAIAKTYGIAIHPWATEDLASRLERAGLLVRQQQAPKHHLYFYATVHEEFDEIGEGDIRLLVDSFVHFAKTNLERVNTDIDTNELEKTFLDHLVTTDFFAILKKPDRTKVDQKKPGTLSIPKTKEQQQWEEEVSYEGTIDVLVASFIYEAYQKQPALYELLVKISNGALLSEVVLNFQDPNPEVNLENLVVLFDAPFIMAALDLCEEESHQYARELLTKLIEKKATIATFSHYCDEIQDNLRLAIARYERNMIDRATDRRLSDNAFFAFARDVERNTTASVQNIGIKIVEHQPTAASYNFFTEQDEKTYFDSLGMYQNRVAQTRDAASVAMTIRLRRGKMVSLSKIQSCGYIFVTNNPWMPQRSVNFLKNRKLYNDGDVPPVISDRYLAGLLWVMFGGKTQELSRYRLLANCAQALEARGDVVNKVHTFLKNTDENKAQRFRAIMTSERAGHHLMQLSLGDSRLITEDNYLSIYESLEQDLEEKYKTVAEQRVAEESERIKEELSQKIKEKDQEVATVREEMSDTARMMEEQLSKLKEQAFIAEQGAFLEQTNASDLRKKIIALEKVMADQKKNERERIQNYMYKALGEQKRNQTKIVIAAVSLTALITLLSAQLATDNHLWQLIAVLGMSAISFLMSWNVPEAFFDSYLTKLRDIDFMSYIEAAGLQIELNAYELNWSVVTVTQKMNRIEEKNKSKKCDKFDEC